MHFPINVEEFYFFSTPKIGIMCVNFLFYILSFLGKYHSKSPKKMPVKLPIKSE